MAALITELTMWTIIQIARGITAFVDYALPERWAAIMNAAILNLGFPTMYSLSNFFDSGALAFMIFTFNALVAYALFSALMKLVRVVVSWIEAGT